MLLSPPSISSKNFTFSKNCFSAEITDLPNAYIPLGKVWDDSCDQGFSIESEKTGKEAVFCHVKTFQDNIEGDILSWKFQCVTPGLSHLSCVIYND